MRNRVKFYLALILLILGMHLANVFGIDTKAKVLRQEDFKIEQKSWNEIIAESINKKIIRLEINGVNISKRKYDIYMNDNRELMVDASCLTELFQCSYRRYSDNRIIIEKGNTKVIAKVDNNFVNIDDNIRTLKSNVVKKNDKVYVPIELITEGLGYTYKFDMITNSAALVNQKVTDKIIPSKYDYRTDGRLSGIKDQGRHSTCWAFASLAALESSLLPEKVRDYSEKNMTLNNGYLVSLMSGGDYTMAMSYLAAWQGPILESYEEGYGTYETPTNVEPDVHVQEIQQIKGKDLERIKTAVFLYGGVESSLYMSIGANNLNSYYYNKDTHSYCYVGTERPNHDVVIIGWDDSYPKSNFNFEPEGDGAFICQNSWGEGFGENGIFYVSYYDSNIGMHNVVYTKVESNDNYDNIYQSDICGFVGQLGYDAPEAYFSNVYTVKKDENLEAVSFYATDIDTEYEIYFVNGFENEHSFENKKLIQKGSFSNAGYYTVELEHSIPLEAGTKCAVIVKIKTPNAGRPIAIEYVAGYETSKVKIDDGEGYISYRGKVWERVEETKGCNICLKMFTTDKK